MDDIKLSEAELETMKYLYKDISENKELRSDILMLLDDGVKALENNLFFASISVLTIFLEKYLRDTLIIYEYRIKNGVDEEKFMEFLEKIEERIEDEKENKRYYGFNEICDKLVEYKKLDLEISNELKFIYETIRNPIQHGLYSRIIRQNIGNKRIPATKIAIKLDGTPEELIKSMTEGMHASSNTTISLHNPITRRFILPEFFKNESIKFLFIIRNLITQIR